MTERSLGRLRPRYGGDEQGVKRTPQRGIEPGGTSVNDWRDYSAPELSDILRAALDGFVEQGYHGTSIRTIAAKAGLSVPGVYHHYASKQALLVAIVELGLGELRVRSEAALAEAGDDVDDQLRLMVECLVLFHAHRQEIAFIAASEIRSLEGAARASNIASRDGQQRLMDDIVAAGIASGSFRTPDPRVTSRAIVTMCTGVAQWYRPDGPLSPEALAADYAVIARASLGGV